MPEKSTSPRKPQAPLQSWLEETEGGSPVLLIAPHAARAGSATRALLNPKVNDLYTAEITRELSSRLSAPALINTGMDRNHLDLNRLSQVTANAPWFLEAIRERVHRIVARHGHATVLMVHGWNIIEPRVDLGLGLRRHGEELRPPGMARVSASDDFIRGFLSALGERLRGHGIAATFGLRYPGGGAQNLLQAFTERHRESEVAALRELSSMSSRGEIDAVQLELSVSVRMPGEYRARCIESMAEVFAAAPGAHPVASSPTVIRSSAPQAPAIPKRMAPAPAPSRVGLELFDPINEIGAMASFDLGAGGVGARIMLLLPGGRVALFTGEGKCTRENGRVRLGPLTLEIERAALLLRFRGPAVIVPDAAAYLSIERALASGWLDRAMEAEVRLAPRSADPDLADIFHAREGAANGHPHAVFGSLQGRIRVDGIDADVSGFGRGGVSFSGLGPQRFVSRRMIWACFDEPAAPAALELRAIGSEHEEHRSGRILHVGGWEDCEVSRIEVDSVSVSAPPDRLSAEISGPATASAPLVGKVASFIPLSRPGPDDTRIFTALGFARFSMGGHQGGGMFEYSRRADEIPPPAPEDEESED